MAVIVRSSPTLNWIVCERTGRWAAALRRELEAHAGEFSEIRLPEELSAAIESARQATVVVVELRRDALGPSLDALVLAERRGARVLPVAVADATLAGVEGVAREAGAVHFVTSPRQFHELVELGRRHQRCVPAPVQTLRERVWARLPWNAIAPTT